MTYSGEKALSGTGGFDGGATKNVNVADDFGAPTGPSTEGATGDDSKITYYTPDLSGFQLGVSYTPREGALTTVTKKIILILFRWPPHMKVLSTA